MPDDLYLKLREERIKKGISQKELGERVGVPQQVINRLEQGQRKLDVELFEKICKALNIDHVGSFYINIKENHETEYKRFKTLATCESIAAHKDGGNFTPEELRKIEEYKQLLLAARPASLNATLANPGASEENNKQ